MKSVRGVQNLELVPYQYESAPTRFISNQRFIAVLSNFDSHHEVRI